MYADALAITGMHTYTNTHIHIFHVFVCWRCVYESTSHAGLRTNFCSYISCALFYFTFFLVISFYLLNIFRFVLFSVIRFALQQFSLSCWHCVVCVVACHGVRCWLEFFLAQYIYGVFFVIVVILLVRSCVTRQRVGAQLFASWCWLRLFLLIRLCSELSMC